MKYLVLSANSYDFNNKDGQRIKGTKVCYINKNVSSKDNVYGNSPMIVNCKEVNQDILEKLPAICNLDFEQVTGRDNRPELILTDVSLVEQVDFSLYFSN